MTFISKAYIIAGIAISPLSNMNGEVAMAIACAAFCIPISITIVRRTASVSFPTRESSELHVMLAIMSKAHASPVRVKLSIISWVYCRKNSSANVISAGKAILLSTLFALDANTGFT